MNLPTHLARLSIETKVLEETLCKASLQSVLRMR
jgi:hypothetical protein